MSSRSKIKHLGGAMFWENNQSDGVMKLLSPCWSVWFPLKSNSLPLNCNFFFFYMNLKNNVSIFIHFELRSVLWNAMNLLRLHGLWNHGFKKKKKAVLGFSKISIWIYVIYSTVNKYSPPFRRCDYISWIYTK